MSTPKTFVASRKNDTLDAVAWRTLGTTQPLERMLELNPALNQLEPVLPVGTKVAVPAIEPQTSRVQHLLKLWD
jgi:phage tail protein X